jgi:hypothetical protein
VRALSTKTTDQKQIQIFHFWYVHWHKPCSKCWESCQNWSSIYCTLIFDINASLDGKVPPSRRKTAPGVQTFAVDIPVCSYSFLGLRALSSSQPKLLRCWWVINLLKCCFGVPPLIQVKSVSVKYSFYIGLSCSIASLLLYMRVDKLEIAVKMWICTEFYWLN